MPDYRTPHRPPQGAASVEPRTLDLFGQLPPASGTAATTKPTPAEWPAGSDRRPVPAFAAPDRPLETAPRPPSDLSGEYDRHRDRLDRADRVTLSVRQSNRPKKGPTDSGRFVSVGYPGGGRPGYAGNLYDRRRPGVPGPHDDLDGHAFQHGPGGRWYLIRLVSGGRYRVEPTTGRRRGRGRS